MSKKIGEFRGEAIYEAENGLVRIGDHPPILLDKLFKFSQPGEVVLYRDVDAEAADRRNKDADSD